MLLLVVMIHEVWQKVRLNREKQWDGNGGVREREREINLTGTFQRFQM